MLDIIVCQDIESLSKKASEHFLKIHKASVNSERFYIMPGGSTPKLFYKFIAKKVGNWDNTKIILSDERMVPENNSNSNFLMVNNELINKINKRSKPSLINYFINDLDNNSIISYLENYIIGYKNPNLAILGFGDDGHTASLFPDSPSLFNYKNEKFIECNNDNEPFFRISLTFNILMSANQIMFLISGKKKAFSLKMCLEGNYNPIKYPAQYLFRNYKNDLRVFCDKNAASELGDIID